MAAFFKKEWGRLAIFLGSTIIAITALVQQRHFKAAAWAFLAVAQLAILVQAYNNHAKR